METLSEPDRYDPEQVFYVRDPATDPQGLAHLLLQRPAGDGFALSYRPTEFPKLVRWMLGSQVMLVVILATLVNFTETFG